MGTIFNSELRFIKIPSIELGDTVKTKGKYGRKMTVQTINDNEIECHIFNSVGVDYFEWFNIKELEVL